MSDTQAAETPLSEHVARFWRLLETETVRICLDLKRVVGTDAPDGPVTYWDGSTFSDDVAKAIVAERAASRKPLDRDTDAAPIDEKQTAYDAGPGMAYPPGL